MTRYTKWKISDVVDALSRDEADPRSWTRYLRAEAKRVAVDNGVRNLLRDWHSTFPHLLHVSEDAWYTMTDAEREALVVEAAIRLNVPKRAR